MSKINNTLENQKEDMNIEEDNEDPEIVIKIQNIVATVNLCVPIELERLQQSLKIAEYNPKRFQAVIMRIREPKCTALVFRTGKMIITGAKTVDESELSAKKYVAIIQKAGFAARFESFQIRNITASCDCGFPISLEGMLYAYSSNCTYEPELFPGLIYRLDNSKMVLLIFVSGKLVITGAKAPESLGEALTTVYPQLLEFRKRNVIISTVSTTE